MNGLRRSAVTGPGGAVTRILRGSFPRDRGSLRHHLTPPGSGVRGLSRPCWGWRGWSVLREPFRLVLDPDGDLGQRVGVLTAVVSAEEQFARAGEHDTHVCLGAAAVAQVHGGQRLAGGHRTGHVASLVSCRRIAVRRANLPLIPIATQHPGRSSRSRAWPHTPRANGWLPDCRLPWRSAGILCIAAGDEGRSGGVAPQAVRGGPLVCRS